VLSADVSGAEFSLAHLQAVIDYFLATLTRQERNFCCSQLLQRAADVSPQAFSDSNARQPGS
jgi:hypothetical protein